MQQADVATDNFNVSQLSTGPSNPVWSIAVFAHNEARNIQLALESIAATTGGRDISIYVLANGCTDSTLVKVRESAAKISNLWLVESDVADKASAWNLFVHDILSAQRLEQIDTCFFMDGDVTLASDALPLLASALNEVSSAEAAGAMPATGRDRDAWRRRMAINGMLAGNCYALRSSFVRYLRKQQVRMPTGLIGEDFFVSWLVASNVWRDALPEKEGNRCLFHNDAEFFFRSLSPWRLADYRTYMRRKWRYTLRALQHQMLLLLLMHQGMEAMPRDVNELYRNAPLPSRLKWCGLDTPLRLIAVLWIRRQRGQSGADTEDC